MEKVEANPNLVSYIEEARKFADKFSYKSNVGVQLFSSYGYQNRTLIEYCKNTSNLPEEFMKIKEFFSKPVDHVNIGKMERYKTFIGQLRHVYGTEVDTYVDDSNVEKERQKIESLLNLIHEKYPLHNAARSLTADRQVAYFNAMKEFNEKHFFKTKEN